MNVIHISEPWITRIVNGGHAEVWVESRELYPDFQLSVVLFGPNLLDENPELGERFMVAYLQAVRQYNEGKTERNIEILAEYSGIDADLLETMCWTPIRDDALINVQSILDMQAWVLEQDLLDEVLAEEDFWDSSFIEAANEMLDMDE